MAPAPLFDDDAPDPVARILRLWRAGRDTAAIARAIGEPEADVVLVLDGRPRRRRRPAPRRCGNPKIWLAPGIVARLTVLWVEECLSATAIADRLSAEFGVALTRSAVLGKARRCDLIGKGGSLRAPPPPPPPPAPVFDRGRVTLPGGYSFQAGRLEMSRAA